MVLEAGLVAPLVSYLSALDEDVQANAAGAIQSICFQETGRDYLRDLGVIPPVVGLLGSENIKVRTRAVGVVHNMSADAASIGDIRREGGIPHLLELLRAPQLAVCCSAAGALQNISRETASQQVILENNGVSTCRTDDPIPALTDLLFGFDIQCQIACAGALLNLMGPDVGNAQDRAKRQAYKKILTLGLVTGMVFHGLYTDEPE